MEFNLPWRRERSLESEDEGLRKRLEKLGVVFTILKDRGFGPLAPTPGPVTRARISPTGDFERRTTEVDAQAEGGENTQSPAARAAAEALRLAESQRAAIPKGTPMPGGEDFLEERTGSF